MITVFYSSIDSQRPKKVYQGVRLEVARIRAHHWVGEHAECGGAYAISDDGIGKITVEGCSIRDLFPEPEIDPAERAHERELDAWATRVHQD